MDIKARAKKLMNDIPVVFFALKDPETPWLAKILAGLTVAYALSPIDLIPDFIPVIGYLDDIIILPVLISLTICLIPKPVWQRNQEKARELWTNEPKKRWYYILPVVFVWCLILALIAKAILK